MAPNVNTNLQAVAAQDRAARARAAEIVRSTSLGPTHPAVEAAVDWLALRRSSDTAAGAVSNFVPFFEFCFRNNIDPLKATRHQARAYLAEQTSAGYAPTTLTLRAAVLRSFFADAIDEEIVTANPFHRLRAGNTDPVTPTPSLTLVECGRLARLARIGLASDRIVDQRNGAMAYLMIRVGPRRREVVTGTWGALTRVEGGTSWRIHGKGNRWAPTALPADAVDVLDGWRAILEESIQRPLRADEPIFPSFGTNRRYVLPARAAAGQLPRLDRKTVSEIFKRLLAEAGSPGPGTALTQRVRRPRRRPTRRPRTSSRSSG